MRIYAQMHENINSNQILRNHGLNDGGRATQFLASEILRLSDPYTPMSSGASAHMKTRAKIINGGRQIVYPGPYAHYLWRGEAMAGRAPKHYTNQPLNFHGAPMRGKEWVNRMMADHSKEIEAAMKRYLRNGGNG